MNCTLFSGAALQNLIFVYNLCGRGKAAILKAEKYTPHTSANTKSLSFYININSAKLCIGSIPYSCFPCQHSVSLTV